VFTSGNLRGDRHCDNRRDQLPVVNTPRNCRGDDRRNQEGDRSSNPSADRRRYANYINQK